MSERSMLRATAHVVEEAERARERGGAAGDDGATRREEQRHVRGGDADRVDDNGDGGEPFDGPIPVQGYRYHDMA